VNFFVTGFPRSRTAWFANYLTYGKAFCLHDGLVNCRRVSDLKQYLVGECAGNSDSALPLVWKEHLSVFGDAPILIVERDIESVKNSFKAFYGIDLPERFIDAAQKGAEGLKANANVKVMQFDSIDPKTAWEFLIGDGYDDRRTELLRDIRVNTMVIPNQRHRKNMTYLFEGIA